MTDAAYESRRSQLETYFDRTAKDKWVALTSNSPVSRIRATVRAGRDSMRATLLDWLPEDLSGARILDAGCGTGTLAVEAARRGADVVAVDLSAALIAVAVERAPTNLTAGSIQYHAGDMTAQSHGDFDYVIAMDSFIHYPLANIVDLLDGFAARTRRSMIFTFAPKTPMLAAMHAVGKIFPRDDRSPAIIPVAERKLAKAVTASRQLETFQIKHTSRISSAFYKSQAMELTKR